LILREQDKHFLWSIYSAVSVILIWKGIWEGIYYIPYINDPFVFLFIGLSMLTFSGLVFKEFDPFGGLQRGISKTMHIIQNHPHRHDFQIKYYDKSQKKKIIINGDQIKAVERGALVIQHPRKHQEQFIPIHRIIEVLYKGKQYWRF